ncbi:unnamed protein product, partial [Symbiodinium necroappetens]
MSTMVALEESLLLQAYRTLCGVYVGHQCPPVITMFSRNDILELASKHLEPASYEVMVQYAATLDRHLNCDVVIDFPKPVGSLSPKATEAEQLAWHYLVEGSGSIWASVRSVVPKLPFDRDTRKFSKGFICTLGLMAKRGTHGLTRQTGGHPNVCRLINQLVLAVCPGLRWSSLTITLDNLCQPHTDMGNWLGDSLALGLSHHDAGGLWIAHPQGCDFVEASHVCCIQCLRFGLIAGNDECIRDVAVMCSVVIGQVFMRDHRGYWSGGPIGNHGDFGSWSWGIGSTHGLEHCLAYSRGNDCLSPQRIDLDDMAIVS